MFLKGMPDFLLQYQCLIPVDNDVRESQNVDNSPESVDNLWITLWISHTQMLKQMGSLVAVNGLSGGVSNISIEKKKLKE